MSRLNDNKTILYKYTDVSFEKIESLFSDKVHFSDPLTFNDPFDSTIYIEPDVSLDELEQIYLKFLAQFIYLKSIPEFNIPHVLASPDLISKSIMDKAEKENNKIKSEFTKNNRGTSNRKYLENNQLIEKYCAEIEYYIKFVLNRGILCLTVKEDNSLMWSHYGDQHKGICIGYSHSGTSIKSVNYCSERTIRASLIKEFVDGNNNLLDTIIDAIFFRKSIDWQYEQECRTYGKFGLVDSEFDANEIIFGMRCNKDIKYLIYLLMSKEFPNLKFYEMSKYSNIDRLLKEQYSTDTTVKNKFKGISDSENILSEIQKIKSITEVTRNSPLLP